MKYSKNIILFSVIALIAIYLLAFSPFANQSNNSTQNDASVPATVTETKALPNSELGQIITLQTDDKQTVTIENDESLLATPRTFQTGDRLMLLSYNDGSYYIGDYLRAQGLFWLFATFVILVLMIAGWQGIGSLVGMVFSFIVIFKFILPQILSGHDPVLTAIIGSAAIIPATFYTSHGFNRKTTIAVASTIITLIITAFLAKYFAELTHLTGTASEEVSFLSLESTSNINFSGLVLAGMIISILGILDDITISQSALIQQLKSTKNKIKFPELYKRGMQVGRDHISSLVNTLILVYAGASLPLLLLFLDHSQTFSTIINYEFMAEEIVRTLIGSLGLILAVPITTIIAAFFTAKVSAKDAHLHCHH